jgi:hypothetical protein
MGVVSETSFLKTSSRAMLLTDTERAHRKLLEGDHTENHSKSADG